MKLEEPYLGDGFIEVPNAFICYILGLISSRILRRLTTEHSDLSQAGETAWEARDEALVRLQKRQEIGCRLTVELSTSLPVEEMAAAYRVFEIRACYLWHRDRLSR